MSKVVDMNRWREVHPGNGVSAIVAEFMLDHSRSCAAWLINNYRAELRAWRAIVVEIADDDIEPMWFRLALATLNPRKWKVESRYNREDGITEYRIQRTKVYALAA